MVLHRNFAYGNLVRKHSAQIQGGWSSALTHGSKAWQDPIMSFLILFRIEEEEGKKKKVWSAPWRASIKAKALV